VEGYNGPFWSAVATVNDNFELLDPDSTGLITRNDVGVLLRAFGQNPTDQELQELLSENQVLHLSLGEMQEVGGHAVSLQAFKRPTEADEMSEDETKKP